ncbi:GGDEF domain-containing protein [Massilia sp. X63]|uniref:GGDEF domain-containing protein n=1 Tax=Massilia sp. X63 TaxID=3237285 RepID=UPI0034DD7862
MPRPAYAAHLAIDPLSGEFADRSTESAYLAHHLARTRPQLAFTLLLCSLYFLGFFATDLAALGLAPDALLLLGARVLVAVVAGSCAWLAWRRPLASRATRLAATVSEVVALSCFMLIAVHRPGEFHWHAMSLAIMLLVIYLYIPNRLGYALGIAALASTCFLALTLAYAGMGFSDLLTLGMLLSLVNTVGALAARRYNAMAREEYRSSRILQHAAERDHLTGCYNRRFLHERLMVPAAPRAPAAPLTVILCDIDNFKQVNDSHGHTAGDAILQRFAALLQAVVREGADSVVRYGGEEFLLVLPDTDLEAGVRLAEWLRTRFAATPVDTADGGPALFATASFGVATGAPEGGAPLAALIDAADKLMYTAKHNGRDRVESLALSAPEMAAAA